jgi:hypothetical protein
VGSGRNSDRNRGRDSEQVVSLRHGHLRVVREIEVLADGHGRTGRDRQHFWRIAYASAKESDSHLRLLAHAGVVDAARAADVLEILDEVRAMTWRLLNPKV